jgi:APA family basic amino acid/polyamine antiporter
MASTPAPAAIETSGLVRSIGPVALTATFIGVLMGSGIFTLPGPMAAAVGSYAPLAYLACAIAVGSVLICFAEACSRVPAAGGPQAFVEVAFGPYWGFLTGAFNWASGLLGVAGVAAAAADALGTAIPALAGGPVRNLALVGWFAILALINLRGVGFAARVVALVTSIKLVPLALFVGVGIWFIAPGNLTLPLISGGSSADIGRAAILGIFMFTGVETALAISGEVRDPARTIPRAVIAALAIYASLCIAVQIVAQGLLGAALAGAVAPLPQAMALVSAPLGAIVAAGAVISMLGYTAGDSIGSPRMLFAMARDGFLPRALGRVHPRSHSPWVASFTHAALCAGLAVSGSFTALATVATLACVMVYFIGCAAALRLRARGVATAGTPVRIPALSLIAAIGIGSMLWVTAQSTGAEAIGIAVFTLVASLVYRFRRVPVVDK